MKTSFTLLASLLFFVFSTSHANNYTNNGVKTNYTLNYRDTLRITGGTCNGKILAFANGAVIIVAAPAVFDPESFSTPAGKIINYGTCTFSSLGTYSGFCLDNYNLFKVSGNLSLYDGTTQYWNNYVGGTITVNGSFSMNNAELTNSAMMTVGNDFAMYTSTSIVKNTGSIFIKGDLNMSNGVLNNMNKISMDNYNAWGGQVKNEGELSPDGSIVFSNGTSYTNKCLLVTKEGFTNYGDFTNEGMLWVGRTGTVNDHFLNSGTFTNSSNAVVRTVKFTNYNTITGGGSYYITADSYASGLVGKYGTTTDTIKVYDVTRTSPTRIFDVQWAIVFNNVVYRPFAEPDTNKINYAGCSMYFKSELGTPLPIVWESFNAKLVQNQPIVSWSAAYEANTRFDVEKSLDNSNFTVVNTQISNASKNYTFTDANLEKNSTGYYRIKGTSASGAVKYTETKTVKLGSAAATQLTVYPNPVKEMATVQYSTDKNEQTNVRTKNIAGQQVLSRTAQATKGNNTITLTEVAQLKAGVYFVEVLNNSGIIATTKFVKN